ncbi:MAG: T9SS type A sorting domain-containing protein, partial [Chitinophagaceae bacterium]
NATKCYQLRVTTSGTALFNEMVQEATPLEKVNIQDQLSKISVYPNPVSSILKIDIPSDYNREDIFSLIDMTGREVMKEKHSLQSGFNHLEMNINSVMPGIYFLKSTGMKPVKVQVVK